MSDLTIDVLEILLERDAFATAYCLSHGWPLSFCDLSAAQIREIRAQEGWKNPLKEE